MAITSDNIDQAKQVEEQLNQKLSSMKPDDPEYGRTQINLTNIRIGIQEYTKSATKTNSDGQLTEDVPTSYKDVNVVEGSGINDYHFEPSVDVVKNAIRSDPELVKRLNLQLWTGDDQVDALNENSSAYYAVADDMWRQRAERAKAEGKNLTRYSKVAFKDNPLKYISGGFEKYASPFISSAGDVMTAGTSSPVESYIGKKIMQSSGYTPEEVSSTLQRGEEINADQLDSSKTTSIAGTLAGYANPYSPITQLSKVGANALGYGLKSPAGKIIVGSGIGGTLSAGEGAVQDTARQISDDKPLDDNFTNDLINNSIGRFLFGAVGGSIGEILGGLARNAAQSMRANNPTTQMVKTLEDAGGRVTVDPINPLSVPENIQSNLNAATEARGVRSAAGIAAEKVAPKISESLERQVRETHAAAGEALQKYHASPQGQSKKRVTEPVKFMIDYLTKGKRVSDVGSISDATPQTANEIRKKLLNEVDFKDVTVDEYQSLKERYGNDIISLKAEDADFVLGRTRQPNPSVPESTQTYEYGPPNPFGKFRANVTGTIDQPPGLPDGTPGLPEPINNPELKSGINLLPSGDSSALSTLQNNPLAMTIPNKFSAITSQSSQPRTSSDPNKITILIPKTSNSQQLEMMQQELGSLLQTTDEGWIRQLDESFRQVRDKFEPLPGVTPPEAVLDDGTKVYGLSALQRLHSQAFEKMNEVLKETGSNSRRNIYNKVKAFGTDDISDPMLLDEAKKLGIENQLFEVAGTRVAPILDQMLGVPTSLRGLKQNLEIRSLPLLEAVGGIPRNPFIADPNTPQGRIQKYLFEDTAKNLLNTTQGGFGRFGNEVYDETNN